MWYRLNRFFFKVWFRLQFRYRVDGRHHEPPPPYLIIANHASAADIPLVAIAVRAPVLFIAKEELMRLAAVRAWIRSLGSLFVRRGAPDRDALGGALALLRRGRVVGVFAEGTRSPDGRLQPLEGGAAYLALHAGVPVLPVVIVGSHRIMPKGARFPRAAPVTVRIGPPLMVPRLDGRIPRAVRQEWTARFYQALYALLPPEQRPAAAEPRPVEAPVATMEVVQRHPRA